MVVNIFDAYRAEIINQNAESSIVESRQIRMKTNKALSSNPNCHFVTDFF